jgi:MYXO-CTERM domain-containing protein
VNQCSGGSNPCKQNGDTTATCTVVGSGGWTCGCGAGFVSTGGVLPTCTNYDACTPQALSDCATSIPGNECIDEAPPSNTYHCVCGDPGSVPIPGVADAGPRCQHIDDAAVGNAADAANDADVGSSTDGATSDTDVGPIDAPSEGESGPNSEAAPPGDDSSSPATDAEVDAKLDARSDDARADTITPPTDASHPSDASQPSDASNGPDQGSADEGGCGCRVAPDRHDLAARAAFAAACLVILFAHRRRHARSKS